MRWLTNFYNFRFKWTATAVIGINPSKTWLSQLVNFKNAIWMWRHFRRTICNKIVFKLGKNATETYGMLQAAFGASCMNWALVFEWHKRFKEGRESVRDDESCGRSKEVRTPELIGQIKNFIDKDHRVSIETISAQFDVSVATVHTIIREEMSTQKICTKFFFPKVLREDHDSRAELINSDPTVLDALVTCDEGFIYCHEPETKRQSSQWKHAGSPRPKTARQSKSTNKLLMFPFFDCTRMIYMHWVPTGQAVNKEYYVEVLREFRKIPSEEASTLQIRLVAFPPGQCSSPQIHPCHRLFDRDSSSASL